MTVLPDVLEPGLRVVFCGTAVGAMSTQVGAYYAGCGNQFGRFCPELA
jgi:TDG/mug DNA glycosylase family protein